MDAVYIISDSDSEEEFPHVDFDEPDSPTINWEVIDESEKVISCPVCQHTDIGKTFITPNACTHILHLECIGRDNRCPMCRAPVAPYKKLHMNLSSPVKPKRSDREMQTEQSIEHKSTQTDISGEHKQFQTSLSFGVKLNRRKRFKRSQNKKFQKKRAAHMPWKVSHMRERQSSSDSWSTDSDFEQKKPNKAVLYGFLYRIKK